MFKEHSIAIVVPAKNEETQIERVLATLPDYVDKVYVVDDGSSDNTSDIVLAYQSRATLELELIHHPRSLGVGAAIAAGYLRARDDRFDITAVMAGDGQMDPAELDLLISPIADGLSDYCKGNRFAYPDGMDRIPTVRKIGNFILSTLTKIVSGYWHVSDTQSGYTAISLEALNHIDVKNIYASYGCPNDILVKLNIAEMRVTEVPVSPLYNVGEQSKMRVPFVVLPILRLLFRQFFRRLVTRYLIISGHPLIFAYLSAFAFFLALIPLGAHLAVRTINSGGNIPQTALIVAGFVFSAAIQLLLTAFWMDADANRHLCVRLAPSLIRAYRDQAAERAASAAVSRSTSKILFPAQ